MKPALLCVLLAGCILPVSTGAPLPATTVGKGRIGGAVSGEAPTLDLIADRDNTSATGTAIAYGAAPAAAMTFTLSYGLGEDTDLEVAGEGALYYFIFPLPTGGSIGVRQHIDAGETFDLGLALKLGHVGSSVESTDSNGNTTQSSAAANYFAAQAVIQTKRGTIRPLLALNILPATIHRDPSDEAPFSFKGLATSITGGVMIVGRHALIGPYLTATNFYSDKFDNSGLFISGGLMFAIRPDRNRPPPPPPPTFYGPPPPPMPSMPPPGPAPMPAPVPEAPQQPPPPAPTTAPM